MSISPSIYFLIPARLIIGFASGLSSVVVPVYLGEIAPPTLRGTLGTCTQFALVIGILMSDIFAFPFATVDMWRWLFAVTPLLCLFQMLISPFLLESPRWLLSRDEKSVEARLVIKQLRGYRTEAEVEFEVDNFLFAAMKHRTRKIHKTCIFYVHQLLTFSSFTRKYREYQCTLNISDVRLASG